LEEELRAARNELEAEKQKGTAAKAARLEEQAATQTITMASQLNDIDMIATESQEQCARKSDLCNQQHEEKSDRRNDKEAERQELANLVNSIMDKRERERQGQEGEKEGEKEGERAAAVEVLSEYLLCSFLTRL